jgi:hypothetical protein
VPRANALTPDSPEAAWLECYHKVFDGSAIAVGHLQ